MLTSRSLARLECGTCAVNLLDQNGATNYTAQSLGYESDNPTKPMNYISSACIALLDVIHFDTTFSNEGMATGGWNLTFTEC